MGRGQRAQPAGGISGQKNEKWRAGRRSRGALAFGVLFTGVFLAGAYLFAAHSFVFLKVLQLFMGPNVVQLKSVALFFTLMGISGALLGSLALSEHLLGRRSIRRFEPACGGSVA